MDQIILMNWERSMAKKVTHVELLQSYLGDKWIKSS
jgi:hypothetical protein